MKIYLREASGEISSTPKDVLTAIYLEFRTTMLFTSTYSFVRISDIYVKFNNYVKLFGTGEFFVILGVRVDLLLFQSHFVSSNSFFNVF